MQRGVRRLMVLLAASIGLAAIVVETRVSGQTAGVDAAMLARVAAAWSTMDVEQAAPFYAKDPDLVFYDVAPLKYVGWAAYAKGEADQFKTLQSSSIALTPDTQIHNSGNIAWTTAVARVEMVRRDGVRAVMTPRWTTVWEKRGGTWQIVHEHFSMAPSFGPPAPPNPPADSAVEE